MTYVDTEPNWNAEELPRGVMSAVVAAAEHAANGRADASRRALADSRADERWLAVAAVRALAGLAAGPNARVWFDHLRAETHDLAAETNADELNVVAILEVIATSEAYERGALGRVDELTRHSQFTPSDFAAIAASLAGQVVAFQAGRRAADVFAALRRRHGIDGAT